MERDALSVMFSPPGADTYRVSRVMALDDAIRRYVRPGMTLHFGYSQARLMAISNALVRCFAGTSPDFTIVGAGFVSNQAAFVAEGLVRKIIASFVGENYPNPSPNPIFQSAIDGRRVEIENQSLLGVYQRLAAGAAGFPFALTRSIGGSSMATPATYRTLEDPFGSGATIGAMPAIVPDVTFAHGIAADEQGNVLMSPPFGDGDVAGFAAREGVIATVEQIVPPDVIRRHAHLVKIPSYRVLALAVAPMGAHPYGLYNPGVPGVASYGEDYGFLMDLRKASATPESFARWTRDWIIDVGSHEGYVRKLGAPRVRTLEAAALVDGWIDELGTDYVARTRARTDVDAIDTMVVAAARCLETKAIANGAGIVEAGVGFANLAAWLAVSRLQRRNGLPVELVAEIGIYGFTPQPGEPFIFSNRNLPTAKSFSTSETVLGLHVSGRHNRCLAIVGAAQIDAAGNVNSTYLPDGRFLVGSGGANDINSAADEVIVVMQQSKRRLVESLPYVTSPGARVTTLVTDLGVFEKRDGRLVLIQTLAHAGRMQEEVVAEIRARTGWPLACAQELLELPAPGPDDLFQLRMYDPRGEFLSPPP